MADNNIPTLGELTAHNVDPELGSGTPANVINNQAVAQGLQQAAQFRAQNVMEKYKLALNNYKDEIKDARDIADKEVMPKDSTDIKKRLADAIGDIGKNPKDFFSGNLIDVDKKLIEIRKDATLSKQHNSWDEFNRKQITANPELDTPQNNKLLTDFGNTPLKDRKLNLLKTPIQVDWDSLFKNTLAGATSATSNDEFIGNDGKPYTGKGSAPYIKTTTGTKTSFKQFIDNWDSHLEMEHDRYGRPVKDQQQQQYDDLIKANPDIKKQFPTLESYWHWKGVSLYGEQKDREGQKTDKVIANPNYKQDEQLQIEKGKLAVEWAKLGIDRDKANAQIALWKSKTTGSKESKNAALNFATTLYNQLGNIGSKDEDGNTIISPEQLRKMTAEQLKYLGVYGDTKVPDPDNPDKTITTKGLRQLNLGDNDVLQLSNGKISVLSNAHLDKESNKWVGKLDPTRTTTLTNIATNKVNEENQLSSGKEVNDYLPTDLFGSDTPPATTNSENKSTEAEKVKGSSGRVYTLPQ